MLIIFDSPLGGEQTGHILKLRVDAEGALTLDFDEEPHLWPMSLRVFREV